ncbi:MAG: radical SAM protein [Candidatus Margulisiibacteriota bacterium]
MQHRREIISRKRLTCKLKFSAVVVDTTYMATATALDAYARHFPPAGKPSVLLVVPRYPSMPERLIGVSYMAGALNNAKLLDAVRGQSRVPMPAIYPEFHVRVLDLNLAPAEFDLPAFIQRFGPTILGVSSSTPTFAEAIEISKVAEYNVPQALRVVGGYHPSALPVESLSGSAFEVAVVGFGEETLGELALCIRQVGKEELLQHLSNIPGVYFKDSAGKIVAGRRREGFLPLDEHSFPYTVFPLYIFGEYPKENGSGGKAVAVISSRGCPFVCKYCSGPAVHERRVRHRSVANLLQEIQQLVDTGVRQIDFWDETFLLHSKIDELLLGLTDIASRNLGFGWGMQTRADKVKLEIIPRLVQAGLKSAGFGVETGDQRLAREVKGDPRISLDQITEVAGAVQAAGVQVGFNLMVGLPGQTWSSVLSSARLLTEARPNQALVAGYELYPGSFFARTLLAEGRTRIIGFEGALPKHEINEMTFFEVRAAEYLLKQIIYYLYRGVVLPGEKDNIMQCEELVLDAIRILAIYDNLLGAVARGDKRRKILKNIPWPMRGIFSDILFQLTETDVVSQALAVAEKAGKVVVAEVFPRSKMQLNLQAQFKHERLDPFLTRVSFVDALPLTQSPFAAIRKWMLLAMNLWEKVISEGHPEIDTIRVMAAEQLATMIGQTFVTLEQRAFAEAIADFDFSGFLSGAPTVLLGMTVSLDLENSQIVFSG